MSYALSRANDTASSGTVAGALKGLLPLLAGQRRAIAIAFCGIVAASATAVSAPLTIAYVIDAYITRGIVSGVVTWVWILLAIYVVGLVATYLQARTMGTVGRRVLFRLRNALFSKLQELPVAFFNENRSGDLISRVNNDTEKLNQFFAQALMQSLNNAFLIAGAGIMLVSLNWRLGLAALAPAAGAILITRLTSYRMKQRNSESLQALGGLSSEIQESLTNFRVIVAFGRFDYFRKKIGAANSANFVTSVRAGISSNVFFATYGLAYNLGQLVVVAYGASLIAAGSITTGLLIGYLLYVNTFYSPLRQLAGAWSSFQLALAALDRVLAVLSLESSMATVPSNHPQSEFLLKFRNVSFRYPNGRDVLRGIDLTLERGKTYALIGPTGGGKTTTASLMARLYDPTGGDVLLEGRDIRSYSDIDRAGRIGFILQEPFLFSGTVRDNIVYGNLDYRDCSDRALSAALDECGFSPLLNCFEFGLGTEVGSMGESISLGQKQIVAFVRAALRRPSLLILDEATASIDTVTERLLESALKRLPVDTTKVIVAHRLNTIDDADEIFFVNSGQLIPAGSMENALDMLLHNRLAS